LTAYHLCSNFFQDHRRQIRRRPVNPCTFPVMKLCIAVSATMLMACQSDSSHLRLGLNPHNFQRDKRSLSNARSSTAFLTSRNSLLFQPSDLARKCNNIPRAKLSYNKCSALQMCQLLGMNCATPTDFNFSFRGFSRRGGDTDVHSDGWGLAWYEGCGVRAFHDSDSAATSYIAEMIRNYPVKTLNMISHIRYATIGGKQLCNVHPFQREMWGINWVYAHNGDLPTFSSQREYPWLGQSKGEKIYYPIGDTDSEAVFCSLLNSLRARFKTLPTLPVLYNAIEELCREIVNGEDNPIFNFLLACGENTLFAYSTPGARAGSKVWNGLYYTIREPPFQTASLTDMDYTINFADVTTENDRVAVIATLPLTTDETWVEFESGQLVLFDEGLPYTSANGCAKVEQDGKGLSTKAKDMLPGKHMDFNKYSYSMVPPR